MPSRNQPGDSGTKDTANSGVAEVGSETGPPQSPEFTDPQTGASTDPNAPVDFSTPSEIPEGATALKFADQDQVELGDPPYVKYIATEQYTHKVLDAGDFRLAGIEIADFVSASWNPTNGLRVPASVFGGPESPAVRRMLADPSREFKLVNNLFDIPGEPDDLYEFKK